MAKTYTAAGSAVAGDVYTAAAHNVIVTNVNNFIVPPACRVQKTSTMNLVNLTDTLITWDLESYDTDGMVTLASSTSEITIGTSGIYQVTGSLSFQANGTNRRAMWITKNGTSYVDSITGLNVPCQATASTVLQTTTTTTLTAGDVIRMYGYQNSGSTLTVPASASAPETIFTSLALTWVGRTS
jgi:hypothetical protein